MLATGVNLRLPRPRSSVVFKKLPEGAILFCTATEVYFSLNSVGVFVWQFLPPTCETVNDVVSRLAVDYPEVHSDMLSADVRELLDDLSKHGLVEEIAA